ncbi:unnamed protein product [Leptidea sinapis]|uniref:DDE Tnp4 domain-containing protein n=1 Tax=Leptidea sinapis TaxID=189913 RepID=A0A5E4QLI0_9NEOP|nr:unnamed protein product [Leptidea sinapis]
MDVQEDAGDIHGLSQAITSRICSKVACALARHASDYIQMPTSFAEEQQLMTEFHQIRGFPTVIGWYYSLNVQVTCDLRIRDVVARWRGSTHDSRIFNESSLKERFEAGEFRGRLLGDSGYRLEPYLVTPILRPNSHAEQKYNAHIATRNVVERCFGVWNRDLDACCMACL